MSAFTEPLAQVRDAVAALSFGSGQASDVFDALAQVERLATDMEEALEFIARRRIALEAFGLKNIADVAERRAVLSAREEGTA